MRRNFRTAPDFGTKQERCVSLGKYIIGNNATVREAARVFGISKSTVHQDITTRLEKTNPALHKQVGAVLEKNKQERHIRGGMATKLKYSAENVGRV
ncbi:MAG: sporulation transcriptional regulator SpoIIID [Oscillospiraceae bacterium]|nr:sporulation transcriptional regulator SpoIIID [Oscillospiraceae bacterium]